MICLTKGELDKLFRDAMSPVLCEEIIKSGLTMDELRSNKGKMLQIVSALTARNVKDKDATEIFAAGYIFDGGSLVHGHVAGQPCRESSAVLTATKSPTYDQNKSVVEWQKMVEQFVGDLAEEFKQSSVHVEYHEVELVVIAEQLPL